MQILYKSEYQKVNYFPEDSLIMTSWFPASQMMEDDVYKNEIRNFVDSYQGLNAIRFLSDMRQFYYTITPEIQHWVAEVFVERGSENSHLVRSAIVVSLDIFSQVSIEQTIGEIDLVSAETGTQYFNNDTDALNWLKS